MLVTDQKTISNYYQALLDREPSYVGIFYVGVKTTSIFCISTCRARKPKLENVEFFTTLKEALDAGYRPCKVCKPAENANEAPELVEKAINLVKDNPKEKITDWQLREHQISPELVRRWFKKNYGMTFQAYQRMYRINNALQELKDGKTATETAFGTGYESLSGFGYTYKKFVGKSPKNSTEQSIILISRLTTPLGPMFVCATDKGVCLLEFVDRRMLETEFKDLQLRLKAKIIAGENQHIKQTKQEIAEYFANERTAFTVTLHTPGTDFQNSVWECLKTIPYGQICSYQQQAEKINKPKAVRAVATANGCNRIAIIIPCHRVIGKNGKLVGYAGGLERKRWLLEHERKSLNL
ncbi:methylated-DNA--[protein]-cysteine S-methyltransferase [Endozoicomonas sp. SM1973]|uniref:Methylated-DNA--protein-cysteine methyltransferase n=1 Tax=Spartinivicinus marinus TaxID=2994442 RepID=A0A853I3E2_9GAMM|nr:methylated-DNA--[protein]-cysteine S-methyltransferase [Spartinivicinus marinus]MCX4028605.1 methylated-DNA--[protein]-cysteine S-methyltransferase [Spartinivicinus marinus]NYZ67129.1 methylated-DNA--[protein]-cysteine S-methyltransferase [Spartinivicinus marinus]